MNALRSNGREALFLAAFCLFSVSLALPAVAQVTKTNTVTNGGITNVGDIEIITNPVSSPITAAITNNGSLQFWQTTALTNSGVISGSGSVTKASGSGNLILSGANTFTSKVTVGSGMMSAAGVSDSAGSGLGRGTQLELGSNANLQVNVAAGTNATTRSLIFYGNGTLGNPGAGSLVWNGNAIFNASNATSFFFNSLAGGTNEFAGVIGNTTNNSAVNLNFQNTQIWRLTGSNTFTGGITIGGGRVIATTISDTGTASSVGAGGAIRFGYFNNAPSTFEYTGSGSTNNRQIKLGASAGSNNNTAFLLQNGSGALVFTNVTFTTSGDVGTTNVNRLLVLGGTNTMDNIITGRILDNVTGNGTAATFSNSTITIVKDGAGKWILAGSNSHTGGTIVSNGVLQLGQTGSLLFFVKGSGINNQLSGTGTLSLKGKFDFDLTAASTNVGASWTIVADTLTRTYEPSFSVNGFTNSGVAWSRITNDVMYVFEPSKGVLSVNLPLFWSVSFPLNLNYNGSPQAPVVAPRGSVAPVFYIFTGIDGTIYSGATPPTAPGNYKLTATVASDGTYAPGSLDVVFSIGNFENAGSPPLRVQADGTLWLDNRPFSGVGVNYYSAFERTLENAGDTSYDAGFAALGRWGVPFARFDVSGYWPSKANLFFTDRAEYFRRLDGVVASAERHGVGLIPSLFWTTFTFSDLAGERLDQLAVSNSMTRQKMREFATEIVDRYKDSPAIWAWEFGNEWNLAVDLPNATEWLPPTWTNLGNPSTRDPVRDVLATDTILPAMREFAELVRELDPGRPISTGHAMSRPSQWHQDQWKRGILPINSAWTTDSLAQAEEIALRQCPDGYDLLSVHVYGSDPQRLPNFAAFAARAGKALFAGEFGAPTDDQTNYAAMLSAIRAYSPLAAVWVFDRPVDEYNITTTNERSWMLRDLLPATFANWSRGWGPNEVAGPDGMSVAAQYVFGSPRPGVAVASQAGRWLTNTFSLEAVVRTNDQSWRIFGESSATLGAGSWRTNEVFWQPSINQSGVLPGSERRVFSVPTGTGNRKFLRLGANPQ